MCVHWRELTNKIGHTFEYCKAGTDIVTCSGDEKQCEHPSHFCVRVHKVIDGTHNMIKEVSDE